MGIFRRKVPSHLIQVHPANAVKKDWLIVLEAGTIVGPSPERLRVARCTKERKIVKKYNILLRAEHFLLVEGYDPRIHTLYFCPQLYRYDTFTGRGNRKSDCASSRGVHYRKTIMVWASEKMPDQPIISTSVQTEFDTVVVELPKRT